MTTRAKPGRLWSLWDIVERYRAENLADLAHFLGRVGMWGHGLELVGGSDDVRRLLATVREEMERAGLRHSLHRLDRIERAADSARDRPASDQAKEYRELAVSIEDELKSKMFFRLTDEEANCFERAPAYWGPDVQTKFPSLSYDTAEAAMCFALGRSTASAFHAIRCLEGGIKALSRCLGIPDPIAASGRSWMKMLKNIHDEMDQRWPGSSTRLNGDGRFFEEAYATLVGTQNPYRNSTMHLDKKYTAEEAKQIMDLVGGFLKNLANRCDEEGFPRA